MGLGLKYADIIGARANIFKDNRLLCCLPADRIEEMERISETGFVSNEKILR